MEIEGWTSEGREPEIRFHDWLIGNKKKKKWKSNEKKLIGKREIK